MLPWQEPRHAAGAATWLLAQMLMLLLLLLLMPGSSFAAEPAARPMIEPAGVLAQLQEAQDALFGTPGGINPAHVQAMVRALRRAHGSQDAAVALAIERCLAAMPPASVVGSQPPLMDYAGDDLLAAHLPVSDLSLQTLIS